MLLNAELPTTSFDEQLPVDTELFVQPMPEAGNVQANVEALAASIDALYTPEDEAAIAAKGDGLKSIGSGDGLGYEP